MGAEIEPTEEIIGHNCSLTAITVEEDTSDIFPILVAGMDAQNHRGEEGAGIATASSSTHELVVHKGLKLRSHAIPDDSLQTLDRSYAAIGHTRYSVTGKPHINNVQPYEFSYFAMAHNGNVNILPEATVRKGEPTSDTFRVGRAIEQVGWNLESAPLVLEKINGSYVFFFLTRSHEIYIATDPWGNRPCLLGKLHNGLNGYVASSESVALSKMHADFVGTVPRGVFGQLTHKGFFPLWKDPRVNEFPRAWCSFENTYFADDTSVAQPDIHGTLTNDTIRIALGRRLANVAKPKGDFVSPVPNSGRSYAEGVAIETGLQIVQAIHDNRYKGRNFIKPHTPEERVEAAFLKFNFIPEKIKGKNLIVVDDSIVRGYTSQGLILALFRLGANRVEVLSGIPPIVSQCHWGIDFQRREELVYHRLMSNGGMGEFEERLARWLVNNDEDLVSRLKISFQKLDDYMEITAGVPRTTEITHSGLCYHCVSNVAPLGLEIIEEASKERYEVGKV